MLCQMMIALLLAGAMATLVAAAYFGFEERSIVPGKIVHTTFTGCPAYLAAALLGPRGEYSADLASQDAADFVYVDVPGSAGAYSSWFRPPSGLNGSAFDPTLQASASAYPWVDYVCSTDDDCLVKPHMACGQLDPVWGPKDASGKQVTYAASRARASWDDSVAAGACGAASNEASDPSNWLTCSFTDSTQNHGFCIVASATLAAAGGNPYACVNSRCVGAKGTPSVATPCAAPSDCDGVQAQTALSLTCNALAGYCQPDYGETSMIMAPWRAEGTVTNVNDDGTVNVQWTRVQLQWPNAGPRLPWFPSGATWDYSQGVFIADDDVMNGTPTSRGDAVKKLATFAVLGNASLAYGDASLTSALAQQAGVSPSDPDAFKFVRDPWGLPTQATWGSQTAWGTFVGRRTLNWLQGNDATLPWSAPGPYTADSKLPGWMGALAPGQTVGGLPTLAQAGGNASQSAWNLKSTFKKTELLSIPEYTIVHTDPSGNSGLTPMLVASMTAYRSAYMADRPLHLQLGA